MNNSERAGIARAEETMRSLGTSNAALDYMIDNHRWSYSCSPWHSEPAKSHYLALKGVGGQVEYRGETFIVWHEAGIDGSGNMGDEGAPPTANVSRVHKGHDPSKELIGALEEAEVQMDQAAELLRDIDNNHGMPGREKRLNSFLLPPRTPAPRSPRRKGAGHERQGTGASARHSARVCRGR